MSRLGRFDERWDWEVRSYSGGERIGGWKLMMKTTHRGDFSKDMEVRAALACNRRVEVTDLRTGHTTLLEPDRAVPLTDADQETR